MVSEYARLFFAAVGFGLGYAVDGQTAGIFAAIFGFFLGHVLRSTTRTVKSR